ncbi:MAG: DUF1491 family protein [Hyphomicrobiaceae bacterium]|nr:DUF1491 family protein [Hyphomicrobiaceae bacterium]MCC0023161.1 DUF1491 family protein [Hyphomicrobiaceae bacterium]
MSRLRSDLWCSAYVRRQNNLGHICVVVRRGDPVAGQVWIEFDHLDGTGTLLSPAPGIAANPDSADWQFQVLMDVAPLADVAARLARESDFDPDFWHLTVEARSVDPDLTIVRP